MGRKKRKEKKNDDVIKFNKRQNRELEIQEIVANKQLKNEIKRRFVKAKTMLKTT